MRNDWSSRWPKPIVDITAEGDDADVVDSQTLAKEAQGVGHGDGDANVSESSTDASTTEER
jgi:hypothetical protein